MDKKRCCFAGHSRISDENNRDNLKEQIRKLVEMEGIREFWVGNYGDFDRYSAEAVRELKEYYSDINLYLVIPYLTNKITENKQRYYKNYDCILIADIPEKTPRRYQIIKTNEYMINNSDFLICYIDHLWGGAAKTFEYAGRKEINIINLSNKADLI